MTSRRWILVSVLTSCLGNLACESLISAATGSEADRDAAVQLAETYFSLARKQNWKKIEGLYDPAFYRKVPQSTWHRMLLKVERQLGQLDACELQTWKVQKNVSSDTLVHLRYVCQHAKYPATVTFTMFRSGDRKSFGILGQNFNSIGLLAE